MLGRQIRWMLLLVSALPLGGCNIGASEYYEVGVPYREQERSDYCVPASVLMWRLYDRLSDIPQSTIYNWLGGRACNPTDVPRAVNHFTNTFDAYLDVVFAPSDLDREEMIARQITSLDRLSPVIAIVGSRRDHVGVMNGGKYSRQGSYYQWDFVYFHDPAPGGRNTYYTAQNWIQRFCDSYYSYCGQILSVNAAKNWDSYYASYGGSILIYGGDGYSCRPGIDCGPIIY